MTSIKDCTWTDHSFINTCMMSFKLIWRSIITERNMLYGATVVASPAKSTHTLHHCQVSDTSILINLHQRIFKREGQTDRVTERERE